MKTSPVLLMILDGFGLAPEGKGNAVKLAKTPTLDFLAKTCPKSRLQASGPFVGLPEGQMGNSEVGHLNIGSGRVIYQSLTKIDRDLKSGAFKEKSAVKDLIQETKERKKALHLMGLVSQGGVHSHQNHLLSLLKICKEAGLEKVYVHAFLDGRDVSPTSGVEDLKILQEGIDDLGLGSLATVIGRYYAMDRDKRYERTQLAYDLLTRGKGQESSDFIQALKEKYEEDETDEFIRPLVNPAYKGMDPEDSLVFFNFRPDRARQLTRAFVDPDFTGFSRDFVYRGYFVTMTNYDKTIQGVHVIYQDEIPKNTLGEYLSKLGKKQFRIAETEKYAHVTFFFNGGLEKPYPGEDRVLIPSPKVATYDLKPEMSALEVTGALCQAIDQGDYDFYLVNFANTDMVGHTGSIPAAIQAVETVDQCMKKVLESLKNQAGKALITADHGNCERMLDEDGNPVTSHTTNLVPLYGYGFGGDLEEGALCDLAPTVLDLMGLEQPKEMTGKSLRKEEA